ncbi:hypothetical protein N8Z80_07955, partial [Litorivicinus sp.]|nr:hypothetical protein [Litorivicinus sp.]
VIMVGTLEVEIHKVDRLVLVVSAVIQGQPVLMVSAVIQGQPVMQVRRTEIHVKPVTDLQHQSGKLGQVPRRTDQGQFVSRT